MALPPKQTPFVPPWLGWKACRSNDTQLVVKRTVNLTVGLTLGLLTDLTLGLTLTFDLTYNLTFNQTFNLTFNLLRKNNSYTPPTSSPVYNTLPPSTSYKQLS